jgi:hypothetical protein
VRDGLSDELREALDSAPEDERALLELRLAWPSAALGGELRRLTAAPTLSR